MTDYTQLIPSTNLKGPKFVAKIALVGGAIDSIVQAFQGMITAFDLDVAVGAQLDVIGQWVGQSRRISVPITGTFFGFADTAGSLTFGEASDPSIGGRFYEFGESFSSTTLLADNEYRLIIRAAIARNQWDGTIGGIEQATSYIFGAPCSVIDPGNLNLTITIGRNITPVEKALLTSLDLLPRPAGVSIGTIQYATPLTGVVLVATKATGHL